MLFGSSLYVANLFRSFPARSRAGFFLNETSDHLYDRSLRGTVRSASERTGIDFGIVELDELPPGTSLEELAVTTFRQYSIGQISQGKGILLLLVKAERSLKIEVSYNLEGIFPDAICSRLERGARTYMLTGNTRDFLTELIVTMGIHFREYQKTTVVGELEFPVPPQTETLSNYLSGGAGVVGRGYASTLAQIQREIRRPSSNEEFEPGETPSASIQRYYQSLDQGIGDPNLRLLTLGSQFFRSEMPMTPGFLRRTLQYYRKCKDYKIFENGNLAIAVYPPTNPVFPILLRRSNSGKWLVDEAGAWAHFHRFEDGSDFYPKYPDNPFLFGYQKTNHPILNRTLYKERSQGHSPISNPEDLIARIKMLEERVQTSPRDPAAYFELGDMLYFECYWRKAALALILKGVELEPKNVAYLWRLFDIQLALFPIEPAMQTLERLAKLTPQDEMIEAWLKKMRSVYEE